MKKSLKEKMMNKYVKDIINEILKEVNGWNDPGASFGAGVVTGIFIKHLDEYEKFCIEQGFDEGLECSENVIMYGDSDFVRKMFPKEDKDYNVFDLVSKYGLRIVNEKYLEYKGEKND